MNYLSIVPDIRDFKNYLILRMEKGVFRIEVKDIPYSPNLAFEINNEDLIELQKFLNAIFTKKEQPLNENS